MTEELQVAEMHDRLNRLLTSLRIAGWVNGGESETKIHDHLMWLWENPDKFESTEHDSADRWKGDDILTALQIGVVFGIEYEQAYPTGRNDEWPVPVAKRPEASR